MPVLASMISKMRIATVTLSANQPKAFSFSIKYFSVLFFRNGKTETRFRNLRQLALPTLSGLLT